MIAKKAKLSPLIGYIGGGLVIGNLFPAMATNEGIMSFAYFGIVFLLFTLGLETNFNRIFILKKFIIMPGMFWRIKFWKKAKKYLKMERGKK